MARIVAIILCSAAFGTAFSTHDRGRIVVTRTPYGFEPATVVVPPGTAITFVNATDTLTWPASDMHPKHQAYQEFDPVGGILPLGAWTFTFKRPGDWSYHDHLEAHIGGIVVVDPEGTIDLCGEVGGSACWTNAIFNALNEGGVESAFDAILELHATYPRFAAACHDYAHDVGLKAYGIYGPDVPLSAKTSYCNAGFFHGYMEGFVAENPDPAVIIAFCNRVAREIGDEFPLAEGQCVHGIGHGALESLVRDEPYLRRDIPRMLRKAMEVCRETQTEWDFLKRCTSGVYDVFRGWAQHADPSDDTYSPERLFGWCLISDDDYVKEGCYHELGKNLSGLDNPEQVASIFDFERNIAPEDYERYAPIAMHAFAINIGRRAVKIQPFEQVLAFCRAGPIALQKDCIVGLFDGIMFSGEPGIEYQRASDFCAHHSLSEPEAAACFEKYQRELEVTYDASTARLACARVPERFRNDVCRAG